MLTSTLDPPLPEASGPPESPPQVPTPPAPLVHRVDAITEFEPYVDWHTALVITCRFTWLRNWLFAMPEPATHRALVSRRALLCVGARSDSRRAQYLYSVGSQKLSNQMFNMQMHHANLIMCNKSCQNYIIFHIIK